MTTPIAYPRRPRFFANRFCRLMTKVCLANEIGPESCFLLMTVAMTEDAKSYRGAVTYWNEQLVPLVGLNNVKSLDRVRGRAVEAGWLHYTPGGKGRPGSYWVVIPADFCGMDDVPTDEDATEYLPTLLDKNGIANGIQVGNKAGEKREESGREAGEKRDTSGQPSTLSFPFLNTPPLPPMGDGGVTPKKPRKPRQPHAEHPHFAAFWEAYPRKTAKPNAVNAFAKINPDEATIAAMLDAIARQKKSPAWCKDGGQYIPHPATWLNGRRWEDQPPEVGRTSAPAMSSNSTPYTPYELLIPKPSTNDDH